MVICFFRKNYTYLHVCGYTCSCVHVLKLEVNNRFFFSSVALILLRKYLSGNLDPSILASNLTPTPSARVIDTCCHGQLLHTLLLGRH